MKELSHYNYLLNLFVGEKVFLSFTMYICGCVHKLGLEDVPWLEGDILQGVVDVELLHDLDVLETAVECSNLGGDERIYRGSTWFPCRGHKLEGELGDELGDELDEEVLLLTSGVQLAGVLCSRRRRTDL